MSGSIEQHVAQHYAQTGLEQLIADALVASGKSLDRLAPSDLSPVDEFHTGGSKATIQLADQAHFAPGSHVLDVGCGIGGPSRYFAGERGCHVTGIDLTPDYVRTAEALARRLGLADRVAYRQASALALPFEAGEFDGAYMMHVGMNIEDKPTLFSGIRRVLKPGGVLAIYDVMRTGAGDLRFPVHWASTPATSFVAGAEQYRAALDAAGFKVVKERDRGDFARAFFREVQAQMSDGDGPPPLGVHILLKRDVAQKLANVVDALEARTIAPIELICRAS